MKTIRRCTTLLLLAAASARAGAQSSSLYLATPKEPTRTRGQVMDPQLQAASFSAVLPAAPHNFAVHDLITVIIREQSSASSDSVLNTNKEDKVDGVVTGFPNFNLGELLNGQLHAGQTANLPKVGIDFKNNFSGNGQYERKDTLTTRLTARIVDIKPNGTLSIEARTFVQNDKEKLTIKVTGYCRPDDVLADNTILSTQLFDLNVAKTHEGELRQASKKGVITKVLETLFNF